MRQILIIHGGNSFSTQGSYLDSLKNSSIDYERLLYSPNWRGWIAEQIPEVDVLVPTMPNSANAQYSEWKVYFEKILPLLSDDVQLVGHSLGGMFLANYLQDNPLARQVRRLILVAPAYNDSSSEDLGSFEVKSTNNLPKSAREVHLFHSQDDPVVPYSELAKFQADLPDAITHDFTDKLHFWDSTFPELLEILKQK